MKVHKYSGAGLAAAHLTRKLKEYGRQNDVRILDVGCGTGLVGEELQKYGCKNIDGADLSAEMLKLAEAKGIYGSLYQGAVGCQNLCIPANEYDAAISVGVFTSKHVGSEGFDDLVHVVKPGGLACFSLRDMPLSDETEYQRKMDQLTQEGKWKLIMKDYNPIYFVDYGAWCYIYQIL